MAGGETIKEHLLEVLFTTKARQYTPLPGYDNDMDTDEYCRLQQIINCDEVYPNIYIGDGLVFYGK